MIMKITNGSSRLTMSRTSSGDNRNPPKNVPLPHLSLVLVPPVFHEKDENNAVTQDTLKAKCRMVSVLIALLKPDSSRE